MYKILMLNLHTTTAGYIFNCASVQCKIINDKFLKPLVSVTLLPSGNICKYCNSKFKVLLPYNTITQVKNQNIYSTNGGILPKNYCVSLNKYYL